MEYVFSTKIRKNKHYNSCIFSLCQYTPSFVSVKVLKLSYQDLTFYSVQSITFMNLEVFALLLVKVFSESCTQNLSWQVSVIKCMTNVSKILKIQPISLRGRAVRCGESGASSVF